MASSRHHLTHLANRGGLVVISPFTRPVVTKPYLHPYCTLRAFLLLQVFLLLPRPFPSLRPSFKMAFLPTVALGLRAVAAAPLGRRSALAGRHTPPPTAAGAALSCRPRWYASATPDAPAAVIDAALASSPVVLFTKSRCPYCVAARNLFDGMGVAYDAVELDKRSDGRDVQDALRERTGQRTVPNIFVGGGHVGGCDDLMQAESDGTLRKMLEGVGITI